MTRKPKLKVAGHELDFTAISFKDIGERVAKSQDCERRGYHIPVEPSQAHMQRVGDKDLDVNLCRECGVWTLSERFRSE